PREGEEFTVVYDPSDVTNFGIGQRIGAASESSASDPVERLERATALRDRGVLSADEFEKLKRTILGS
ncbi:MAG: SHOCT domain-containing protein, partial [Candidatus Eremiobacteraeota bacterium]|nr:SHOCT domain-containing protein [Candidatus Eremiobacteraeota bacterium]